MKWPDLFDSQIRCLLPSVRTYLPVEFPYRFIELDQEVDKQRNEETFSEKGTNV